MADILNAAQLNTQSPPDPAPPVPEPIAPEPTTPEPSTDSLIVPPPPPSSPPPEQQKQKEAPPFEKSKPKSRVGALLAGLLLLVITLPILVVFVKQQVEIRSRATGGVCTAPDVCLPVSSCNLSNREPGEGTCTGPYSCCGAVIKTTKDLCAQGDTYCVNTDTVAICKSDKSGYDNTSCGTNTTCSTAEGRCIPKPTKTPETPATTPKGTDAPKTVKPPTNTCAGANQPCCQSLGNYTTLNCQVGLTCVDDTCVKPPTNTCAGANQPCCQSLGNYTTLNCQAGLTCNSSNICVTTSGGGTLTCECNPNTQSNCSSTYTGSPEKCVSGGCNSSGNNSGNWLSCSLTDTCIYDNRVPKCVGTQMCDVPVGEMGWLDDSCKGKAGGTNTTSCPLPHYCTTIGTCIKNGTCTPAGMSNTNCHTDASCGGNTPTTTPTKTPTPTTNPQCISLIAYDTNGNALSAGDLNALHVGDTITLAFAPGGAATKVHFRVNAGAWTESTTKNTNGQFTWTYTLENVTDFLIEAQWFDGTVWH